MESTKIMEDLTGLHLVDEQRAQTQHGQCKTGCELVATNAASSHINGGDPCSRAPSPPSTGANTPTLRIAPCPDRLLPIYPPFNYGTVEHKSIYRSSYPLERNIDFIIRLHIKTVL
nr:hypothetical protein CFP56_67046 [Quercus suber]